MNLKAVPTKGNLIAAKNSLKLAKQGYNLMDKKRNILIRELMEMIENAKSIQYEIDETFRTAYECLESANIEMGITGVMEAAQAIPVEESVKIKVRSIMGTEIPLIIRLAMVENSAYRLAMNIKKTQKRTNALQNITIPATEAVIKTISDALEEKEREDFIRLKVIKREMNKKNPAS